MNEKNLPDDITSKSLNELTDLVNEINTNCDYNDEVAAKLKSLMEDFKEKGVY